MTPTVDVEITSETTARATLASDATVPPMELEATASDSIDVVVHRFVSGVAKDQGVALEVVFRKGENKRFLTVFPDGKVEQRTPSAPMPATAPVAAEPAPEAPPTPLPGPVVVSAEAIDYEEPPQPVQAPAQAAPRPVPTQPVQAPAQAAPRPAAAPTPSPVGQRPDEPITGPITGPLEGLSQLSAPRVNPESSDPARLGVRGRLNAMLGLKLAPKSDSLEMRLRGAQSTITRRLPEGALVTFANVKGGVGKTPMSIGVADILATYRGAGSTVCVDLGEVGGSFADRIAVPPEQGQDVVSLLAGVDPAATDIRPATLARYLTRQPSGADAIAGRAGAEASLSYEAAAVLGSILGRHRDVIVADTGNSALAGSWQWAIGAASAVVIPIPMRRDAAKGAQHALASLAAVRPDLLARTVVVITEGPGDAPMVENEVVEVFTQSQVRVCRMPFDPLFASGERITLTQLRREARDALTVLAATVVDLMAGAVN
ncbi:MinD/ParA family ATP-binding protein [Prescottella equi]|uniref:MinD/ParA family ATP-binding protein n=1 Tax=Rhodococcus hoagii TaxID=43767 RepID=UPI0007CD857A|nr:ParA family protein [Prescottella equi]